jgi:hypothetical protein
MCGVQYGCGLCLFGICAGVNVSVFDVFSHELRAIQHTCSVSGGVWLCAIIRDTVVYIFYLMHFYSKT